MIAYSHLAMGLCIIVHVLANFIQAISQGLAVHKILFKPFFSPLSIARVFAGAGVFILIFLKSNFSFYQYLASVFSAKAAYYQSFNENHRAKSEALKALKFDALNHQSTTLLAGQALNEGDMPTAQYLIEQSIARGGTPQSHAALAQMYFDAQKPFEAAFALKKGLGIHPKSGYISTNLAWMFENLNLPDSTLFYLENTAIKQNTKSANLMAFWAKNSGIGKIDSLVRAVPVATGMAYAANLMAIKNRRGQASLHFALEKLAKDSLLNVSQFAVIFNATATNKPVKIADIEKIASKNDAFLNDFSWAIACKNFYTNAKTTGLNQIENLSRNEGPQSQLAKRTLGVWALQLGLWQIGLEQLAASGDDTSVQLLKQQGLEKQQEQTLRSQATILRNLKPAKALETAPHNSFVLANTCPKVPAQMGYQYAFDALQWQPNNPLILETYIRSCLPLGMFEYALVAAQRLPNDTKPSLEELIYQAEAKSKAGF
jgi:hypothetical protein